MCHGRGVAKQHCKKTNKNAQRSTTDLNGLQLKTDSLITPKVKHFKVKSFKHVTSIDLNLNRLPGPGYSAKFLMEQASKFRKRIKLLKLQFHTTWI